MRPLKVKKLFNPNDNVIIRWPKRPGITPGKVVGYRKGFIRVITPGNIICEIRPKYLEKNNGGDYLQDGINPAATKDATLNASGGLSFSETFNGEPCAEDSESRPEAGDLSSTAGGGPLDKQTSKRRKSKNITGLSREEIESITVTVNKLKSADMVLAIENFSDLGLLKHLSENARLVSGRKAAEKRYEDATAKR